MVDTFYSGSDWEGSSGPIISRMVAAADLWPHGLGSELPGAGNKDVLEDGLHPVLALGSKANRPNNLTGVVMKYINANLVVLNVADKFVVKQYVANILTYNGGNPATWAATFAALTPVYVDDSDGLTAGVTLSLSPLNAAGSANPLAGYIFYCQDDYLDAGVGGPNIAAGLPITGSAIATVEALMCVMLVNDSGQTWSRIAE